MQLELEEADGRFGRLDEGKPLRLARIAAARSLYATARPLSAAWRVGRAKMPVFPSRRVARTGAAGTSGGERGESE
eukprot:4150289-Prymnesium_polylepis.1